MSRDEYFSCSEGEDYPPLQTELAAYAVPAQRRRGRPRGCRAGRHIQAARAAAIARATVGSLTNEEREELLRLRTENRRLRECLQAAVDTSNRLRDRVWRLQDEAALASRGPPPPATCRPPHRYDLLGRCSVLLFVSFSLLYRLNLAGHARSFLYMWNI